MSLYTSEGYGQILKELLEGTVTVVCEDHPAQSLRLPPCNGCRKCSYAFWFAFIAKLPPKQQREAVERLIETAKTIIEMESKGTWDFKPYKRPEIKIERDAE